MRFKEYSYNTKIPKKLWTVPTGVSPIIIVDGRGKAKRKGPSKYNDTGDPFFALENLQSRTYPDFYDLRPPSEDHPGVRIPCWRTEDGVYINAAVSRLKLKGPPNEANKFSFGLYIPESHPLFNFDVFTRDLFLEIEEHINIFEPEVVEGSCVPFLKRIFKEIKTNPPK